MRLGLMLSVLPVAIGAGLGQGSAGHEFTKPEISVSSIDPDFPRAALGSVGKLQGAMTCTGSVVVHPRLVVTAAHCVTFVDGRSIEDILFQPSYLPQGHARVFHGHVASIGSTRQFAGHTPGDEPKDWAIVLLDEPLVGVRPLSLRLLRRSDLTKSRGAISLPAYSRDAARNDGMSIVPHCSILDVRWEVFIHDCDASAGSSGAPLLMSAGESFVVVGINSATIYLPGRGDKPGTFMGAAVRSASFEASLLSIYDAITTPATDEATQ